MKNNRIIILILLTLTIMCGCAHELDDTYWELGVDVAADRLHVTKLVNFSLQTGFIDSNGQIHPELPYVELEDHRTHGWIQIIASVHETQDYDPALLRVHFTSDYVEWVGSYGGEVAVFDTEEECHQTGLYCEPVKVGTGTSGVFEIRDNMQVGVQIVNCRKRVKPYEVTVSSGVYDISNWDAILVSDIREISIECR